MLDSPASSLVSFRSSRGTVHFGRLNIINVSEWAALTLDTTGSTSTGDNVVTQSLLMELSAPACSVEVEEGLALVALIGNDLSKACGVAGKEGFW